MQLTVALKDADAEDTSNITKKTEEVSDTMVEAF